MYENKLRGNAIDSIGIVDINLKVEEKKSRDNRSKKQKQDQTEGEKNSTQITSAIPELSKKEEGSTCRNQNIKILEHFNLDIVSIGIRNITSEAEEKKSLDDQLKEQEQDQKEGEKNSTQIPSLIPELSKGEEGNTTQNQDKHISEHVNPDDEKEDKEEKMQNSREDSNSRQEVELSPKVEIKSNDIEGKEDQDVSVEEEKKMTENITTEETKKIKKVIQEESDKSDNSFDSVEDEFKPNNPSGEEVRKKTISDSQKEIPNNEEDSDKIIDKEKQDSQDHSSKVNMSSDPNAESDSQNESHNSSFAEQQIPKNQEEEKGHEEEKKMQTAVVVDEKILNEKLPKDVLTVLDDVCYISKKDLNDLQTKITTIIKMDIESSSITKQINSLRIKYKKLKNNLLEVTEKTTWKELQNIFHENYLYYNTSPTAFDQIIKRLEEKKLENIKGIIEIITSEIHEPTKALLIDLNEALREYRFPEMTSEAKQTPLFSLIHILF